MRKNVMPPGAVDADQVARKIASDPDVFAMVAHKRVVEDEIKSTPAIMDERLRIASIASSMIRVIAGVLYAPTVCAPQGIEFLDAALADQAVLCLHKLFLDDKKNKKGRALLGSKKLRRSGYDPMFHPLVQPESARHRPLTRSFGGGELVLPVAYANLRGVSLRDDVASIETARMFDYERGATIDARGFKAQVLCHIRKRGMEWDYDVKWIIDWIRHNRIAHQGSVGGPKEEAFGNMWHMPRPLIGQPYLRAVLFALTIEVLRGIAARDSAVRKVVPPAMLCLELARTVPDIQIINKASTIISSTSVANGVELMTTEETRVLGDAEVLHDAEAKAVHRQRENAWNTVIEMPLRWQKMMAALRTHGITLNDCMAAMLRTLTNLGDDE